MHFSISTESLLLAASPPSLNSFSACAQTGAVSRAGNSSSDGSKSVENCSDASRGRSVGRWSIETTVSSGLPGLREENKQKY